MNKQEAIIRDIIHLAENALNELGEGDADRDKLAFSIFELGENVTKLRAAYIKNI